MNRRNFLSSVWAVPFMIPLEEEYHFFGHLTRDNCLSKTGVSPTDIIVMLDGRDVTRYCIEANDKEGYVIMFQSGFPKDTAIYTDEDGRPVKIPYHGKVRFYRNGSV